MSETLKKADALCGDAEKSPREFELELRRLLLNLKDPAGAHGGEVEARLSWTL